MVILPSIDLMQGQCVRLKQGCFTEQTTYQVSPAAMAKQFKAEGAKGLHVVDLQGAKTGAIAQLDTIKTIVNAFGDGVQVGGGVHDLTDIERLLDEGVARVVVGTALVTQYDQVRVWINRFGIERLVFALDVRIQHNIPYVSTFGWQNDSKKTLWELLDVMSPGSQILCTDIGHDGMQGGPNFRLYQMAIANHPQLRFQSSGGISTLSDLQQLKAIQVSAAIIGKAFYEGQLQLTEVNACLNDESFLV